MCRIVSELRPQYVLVENVAALLGRGAARVLGDFAEIGYDTDWEIISAADVGAKHLRERVWIVAYPYSSGCKEFDFASVTKRQGLSTRLLAQAGGAWRDESGLGRVAHGIPERVDRISALGNASSASDSRTHRKADSIRPAHKRKAELYEVKTDIWMPLYVGDYLASTQHLSCEESGAYLHLLMHSWKNGPLPGNAGVVAPHRPRRAFMRGLILGEYSGYSFKKELPGRYLGTGTVRTRASRLDRKAPA